MAGNIIGTQNPTVGTTAYYEVSIFSTLGSFSAQYEWHLFKKQKNNTWKDITGTPKTGKRVPYTFGEIAVGIEFEMKVYEIPQSILPSVKSSKKLLGTLVLLPTSSKVSKIEKVVLFNRGAKDSNKAGYRDTLIAQAHCIALFNQEIEFHLWEDDAPGKGHNAAINKNNRHTRVYKAVVNEKGIAEVKIPLSTDERILRQMANQYLMRGDKNEGPNHEYYVTASYAGKIQRASQVNVSVANPDYKSNPPVAAPKKDSPKFPTGQGGKKQPDPKGNIIDAVFIDDQGKELSKVTVGNRVRVRIHSKNLVGKHIQHVIWEYDAGSNDEIYRSESIKITADLYDSSGFIITKGIFDKGTDLPFGDPDADSQHYFIEIITLDIGAESVKFGVHSEGLMEVENVKSPAVVKATPQTSNNTSCICKEQYKDLVWGEKVSCEFRKKVVQICAELWGESRKMEMASELMTCMALETQHSFSPSKGYPNATGLVQFTSGKYGAITAMNETGYNGGNTITKDFLKNLTAESQLDYVKLYFKMWMEKYNKKIKDSLDMYMTIWCPSAVGQLDSFVCYSAERDKKNENNFYEKNKSAEYEYYDENEKVAINRLKKDSKKGNGEITKGELRPRLKYWKELGKENIEKKFTCLNGNTNSDSINAKDIITYHIYFDGNIEKHIPKKIKTGFEKKYKYLYHDSKNNEHEICIADWHTTKEKGVGQVYKTKPTHSKIISDQNVSEGNTSRRIKYENGDIAEYGTHPKKGVIWLLYKAGKNNVELLKMPDSINYKKDNVYIAYNFTDTQRRYTGVNAFAGFIGFLAQSGYKLKTSGSCFSEGSSFPSQEHCNGRSVDTLYLGIVEQDQKIIDKAIFFHFTEVLKGVNNYCLKLKNAGNGGTLHNSHLHSGNFDSNVIKIISEK